MEPFGPSGRLEHGKASLLNSKNNKVRQQMKSKLSTLASVLILSALILSGCGPGLAQPTEVSMPAPTELVAEPLTVIPATTPTVAVEASDAQAARDAALTYIIEHYAEQAPSPGLTWTEEFTPEEPFHLPNYQDTAEDWVVMISYRTLPVVYQVVVANQTTGFRWEGTVDLLGQVTEQLSPDDVRVARDAALAYIIEHYAEESPAPALTWTEDFIGVPIPEGPWGAGTFQYTCTAEDWAIYISYQFLAPRPVVYEVVVAHEATRFHWQGEVDAAGRVTEKVAPK